MRGRKWIVVRWSETEIDVVQNKTDQEKKMPWDNGAEKNWNRDKETEQDWTRQKKVETRNKSESVLGTKYDTSKGEKKPLSLYYYYCHCHYYYYYLNAKSLYSNHVESELLK